MSNQATQLYQAKNTELSNYIDKLLQAEQELIQQIGVTKDPKEQARLSKNLILIQDTRTDLINALSSINTYYTQNLTGSSNTLEQQTNAVAIMDREMIQAQKRLAYINEQKQNKLRVVEINQYYSASYAEWTRLVKIIITSVLAFTLVYTASNYFPLIPSEIYSILIFIVSITSLYFIFATILSIISRDNMVYDEYTWKFDTNSAPKFDPSMSFTNPFKSTFMTCIGQNCCQYGTIWQPDIGKCVGAK
jgi:ABC-type multidrug transport system fused ATPase/permease subunit